MLQEYISNYKTMQVIMALLETIEMTVIPGVLSVLLGGLLGLCLFVTRPEQNFYLNSRAIYKLLDLIVNIGRSIPFIILMIAIPINSRIF